MAYSNTPYSIEKNFNDFGSHASRIGLVGKTEVTILDNLYNVSQLIHGRIMTGSNITGGYRVYFTRKDLNDIKNAYAVIIPYGLSQDLQPLVYSLMTLINSTKVDTEISIDNKIVLQIVAVNNAIALNLKKVWEGVVGMRLLSESGCNKDVTIDGDQEILDGLLGKFSDSQLKMLKPIFDNAGQLSGIKSARQVEMRDMVSDLLFSRKDSFATLHEIFHTTRAQRAVLRSFRTDILFCPVSRYSELNQGLNIRAVATIENDATNVHTTITPIGFKTAQFDIKNNGLKNISLTVAGSLGSGAHTLAPKQRIYLSGTAINITTEDYKDIDVDIWADIREYTSNIRESIVSYAIQGLLANNDELKNIFFQIIRPVFPYLTSFVNKFESSPILKTIISKLPEWTNAAFKTLLPGNLYSGWLLTDVDSQKERTLYIYMLTFMLPEFLLDPTFTFNEVTGTPPYVQEYVKFVDCLRELYD